MVLALALALSLGLIADSSFGEVRNVDRTAAAWTQYTENPKNSRSNPSVGKIAAVLKINSKAGWYISSLVGP